MDVIDLIIYFAIAFSGTVFGSFFTLAVHRIPKHQDITHVRSYCPKCNHKLQFLDLIPVFSYIFLGGKCRYCKDKIRPRYLILEICSGIIFILLALSHNLDIQSFLFENFKWISLVYFILNVLFICEIFIIAGIDREYKKIPNSLVIYGLVICSLKIAFEIFLTTRFDNRFNYTDVLYLQSLGALLPIIVLIIELVYHRITKKDNLPIGIGDLKYLSILGLFFGIDLLIYGIFATMCIILFVLIVKVLVGLIKGNKEIIKEILKENEIPLGFYLAIPFTILLLMVPYR